MTVFFTYSYFTDYNYQNKLKMNDIMKIHRENTEVLDVIVNYGIP